MLFIISMQGFQRAARQYEQAARVQPQAAVDRVTSQHQSEMEHQLWIIEQTCAQDVDEQHLHIPTEMHIFAESSMTEERASLIPESETSSPTA